MDKLVRRKMAKLDEQKRVADHMHALLTRQDDGLNETSRKTLRNLDVAVVVSKQPGFFEYYKPTQEVERIVRQGDMSKLTRKLARLEQEISSINSEMAALEAARRLEPSPGPEMNTLRQWRSRYGAPEKPIPNGFLTEVLADPKIYGGSAHHRAFKSQAMTMKVGRLTR